MWVEVALWLGIPLVGAALALRLGVAPAPVMAVATGTAIIVDAVADMAGGNIGHSASIDAGQHDTYYVIAHNHFLLQFGAVLIMVALPLALIARCVPRPAALGPILFLMLHIGAGLTLFPQRMLTSDLPRRYVEYEGYYETVNRISFAGAGMSFIALSGIALASLVALYRMGLARRTR